MVSPTGQIIVPAACPGSIVVDFMTNHLEEASRKADEYKMYFGKIFQSTIFTHKTEDFSLFLFQK